MLENRKSVASICSLLFPLQGRHCSVSVWQTIQNPSAEAQAGVMHCGAVRYRLTFASRWGRQWEGRLAEIHTRILPGPASKRSWSPLLLPHWAWGLVHTYFIGWKARCGLILVRGITGLTETDAEGSRECEGLSAWTDKTCRKHSNSEINTYINHQKL